MEAINAQMAADARWPFRGRSDRLKGFQSCDDEHYQRYRCLLDHHGYGTSQDGHLIVIFANGIVKINDNTTTMVVAVIYKRLIS